MSARKPKTRDPKRRSSLVEADLHTLNALLKEDAKISVVSKSKETDGITSSNRLMKSPSSDTISRGATSAQSENNDATKRSLRGSTMFTSTPRIANSAPTSPSVPHMGAHTQEGIQKDEQNMEAKMDDRLKVIEELWDTERQYVTDLEVIVNMYLIPLRDVLKNRESIIPGNELHKVFSNVETLLSVNTEVLAQLDIALEKGIKNSEADLLISNVSKVFIQMFNGFKVYAEYCASNPQQIEALNQLAKNSNYVAFEDLTPQSCNKIRLDGFIAKPVQRILKYPLFFSQMLKASKPDDLCYPTLKKGFESAEGIAKYVNEYKNQKENREKLQAIDSVLHGLKQKLCQPGRIFYREATLSKLGPKSRRPDTRRFWLFNDMTVYAKEKGNSYVYKGTLPNHQLLVRDFPSQPNTFQLKVISDNRIYTITCKSEMEKNEWIKDYRRLIDEITLKQDKSAQVVKQLLAKDFQ